MKKCPPGVICIQNINIALILIILLVIGYFIYSSIKLSNEKRTENIDIHTTSNFGSSLGWLPSYPYNNNYGGLLALPGVNTLQDAYAPPLKDERYFVPINVSTNIGAVDTNYRQMGIVTPLNGESKDNILPLMGRPLFTNRDKWQYYTISNQHNNVKLPISYQGKSALNDYGVNQIYTGDTIFVEGYNEPFAVTMYENDTIKYLPYL